MSTISCYIRLCYNKTGLYHSRVSTPFWEIFPLPSSHHCQQKHTKCKRFNFSSKYFADKGFISTENACSSHLIPPTLCFSISSWLRPGCLPTFLPKHFQEGQGPLGHSSICHAISFSEHIHGKKHTVYTDILNHKFVCCYGTLHCLFPHWLPLEHYLSQFCDRYMSPHGVARPHLVNWQDVRQGCDLLNCFSSFQKLSEMLFIINLPHLKT